MKRIILATTLSLMLLLAGCTGTPVVTEPDSEASPPDQPTNPRTRIEYEHLDKLKSPIPEGFGVSGHCNLNGVYPGYWERVPLLIRNGQDKERLFVIHAVSPTKPTKGFEALPEEYLQWFTVEEPRVELGIDEYRWVYIIISMPYDADYAGKHAEVRIRIDDTTQTGLVRTALESKWFITTTE